MKMSDEELVDVWDELHDKLPESVANDIDNRMLDWIMMGGHFDDRYMWSQIDYAKKIIEIEESRGASNAAD